MGQVLNPMISVLTREKRGIVETVTHRKECCCVVGGRDWTDASTCRGAPRFADTAGSSESSMEQTIPQSLPEEPTLLTFGFRGL